MNRFVFYLSAILFLTGISVATAQVTVNLKGEPIRTAGLSDYQEFEITIKNEGFAPVTFYVERTTNDLPDKNWASTICMGDLCYDASVSKPNPDVLNPNEEYHVNFTVYTGEVSNATGTFVLKFVIEGFGGGEFGQVEMNVTTSDLSSIPVISEPTLLPYPNPAITDVTLPLTAVKSAESVEVYDITGSRVRLFDGSEVTGETLRVSTTDFMPGIYYYKIVGSEETRSGTFQVIR
ncbi:MAG: T9SS type A sorting domain-containing protein [Ignavibacteriae bacterium]|nr:T9SS type A sorting domain-containing protein [Ignavibacteriota bacterium]MCB9216071.1 T9SS type A sorting domain-containing protein [Ignavibacteria bacterium]